VSLLDYFLLAAIAATTLWWIFAPTYQRRFLRLAPVALAAIAALQLLLEGFYWQFIPAYVLIAIFALLSLTNAKFPSRLAGLAARASLAIAALIVIAPFALFLPVPVLPKPSGPYAVGTEIFRWVDEARAEPATPLLDDKRNVIAQTWYPVGPGAKEKHSVYMDGLKALPAQVSLFPGFMLKSFGAVDTHAAEDAAILKDKPWPVVIFSPGYGAVRAVYSGLAAGLASRGYFVVTLDHPYESAVTELADGSIVADANTFPAGGTQAERDDFMASQLNLRSRDISFVIDQFSRPAAIGDLSRYIDLQHVAVIGHSFGGAAAALTAAHDPRVAAAANIDGTLYGDVWKEHLTQPFLLLDSDHGESGRSEDNIAHNKELLANLAGPGWAYEIHTANHFSFTDAPLFFAPPGRFALSLVIGGSRGPEETQRAAIDILDAFLSEPLGRERQDINTAVGRYNGIIGGRTNGPN
jgi:predicted dienelactone hydrolase